MRDQMKTRKVALSSTDSLVCLVIGWGLTMGGCATLGHGAVADDKQLAVEAREGGEDVCEVFDFAPGCDPCEAMGWYQDGECDDELVDRGVCSSVDPDCGICDGACDDAGPLEPRQDDSLGEGADCGGFAGLECPAGYFCDFADDALCGGYDQMGQCQAMPDACSELDEPVCGCDGRRYGNECEANAAGTDAAAAGECM